MNSYIIVIKTPVSCDNYITPLPCLPDVFRAKLTQLKLPVTIGVTNVVSMINVNVQCQ